MSNQSNGRKISKFTAQTSLPSDAELTYISGNTNYRIALANFQASLGVTGTIVQDGAVTGTPVLNTSGSVNNIRNLEDGSGIKTSVSAENGITIEHNFTEDTTGVELVVDLTALQPKFRSLVAGSGINIAATNGEIQIALSSIPVSTKTIIVNDINDFPAAVAGVITLADDTEYAIRNSISTANRFVLGNNCVLSGSDNIVVNLAYTGTGNMFTSLNKSWTLKNLTLTCSSGALMDFDGTGAEILQVLSCNVVADTLGTINDFKGIHFDDLQFNVTTDGFTFGGTNGVILFESILGEIAAGTLLDLGAATFDGFSVIDAFFTLNGASVFLSGAASSANMNAGRLATVHNCRFFGTGTVLSTITIFDKRWSFLANDAIADSHDDCYMTQVGNATATTISALSTPVKLAGVWTEEHASHFTTDATGKMTYDGIKDIHSNITMTFSAQPASGSNKSLKFYVAINGSVVTNTGMPVVLSSGTPQCVTVAWRGVISDGDFIEAYAENNTDTIDILVTDAALRVD